MKEQRFTPNGISQPYGPGYCWHGIHSKDAPPTAQLFCRKLAALYIIYKGFKRADADTKVAEVRMYLCDSHVKAMQKKGYTVERVKNE